MSSPFLFVCNELNYSTTFKRNIIREKFDLERGPFMFICKHKRQNILKLFECKQYFRCGNEKINTHTHTIRSQAVK